MAIEKIKGKSLFTYVTAVDTGPEGTWAAQWKTTLIVDKETRDYLKNKYPKIKIKRTDGDMEEELGDYKLTISRKEERRGKGAGQKNQPPKIFDAEGNLLDPDDAPIIGNGSTVEVKSDVFTWNNSYGTGVGCDFMAIRILELVEYVPEGESGNSESDEPEVKDGGDEW